MSGSSSSSHILLHLTYPAQLTGIKDSCVVAASLESTVRGIGILLMQEGARQDAPVDANAPRLDECSLSCLDRDRYFLKPFTYTRLEPYGLRTMGDSVPFA